MYDRISLNDLLVKFGFVKIKVQSHLTSFIPKWSSYYLDMTEKGMARKPDSIYIEGVKND
jgi:hypothetical protein|tara:strand:- start:186 stop:365 length:180 start_codon:yes stop_codon:yes gene_type:complete